MQVGGWVQGGPGSSLSSRLLLTVRLCSSTRPSLLPPLSTHTLRPCLPLAARPLRPFPSVPSSQGTLRPHGQFIYRALIFPRVARESAGLPAEGRG